MSVVTCQCCDQFIDSDDDPDCFCEAPNYISADFRKNYGTRILCEPCRESEWEQQQENA